MLEVLILLSVAFQTIILNIMLQQMLGSLVNICQKRIFNHSIILMKLKIGQRKSNTKKSRNMMVFNITNKHKRSIRRSYSVQAGGRAENSLGTWEPGSHEMFKLKRIFW